MNPHRGLVAIAAVTVCLNATAGVFGVATIIHDASWLVFSIAAVVLIGKSVLVHQWGRRGFLAACLSIPPILAGVTVSITSHYSVMFDAWQRATLSATTAKSQLDEAERRVTEARAQVSAKDAAWAEEIKRGGEGRIGSSIRLDRDRMIDALHKAEETSTQARAFALKADSSSGPLLPAAQSLGLPIREVSLIYLGLFALALELTEIGLLLSARHCQAQPVAKQQLPPPLTPPPLSLLEPCRISVVSPTLSHTPQLALPFDLDNCRAT